MSRYRETMSEALQKVYNETPQALVQKAKEIAKKMAGSYTNAVKEIEKLQKGLSNNSSVKDALLKANEEVELEEGRMKDIYTMQQDGKSAAEIAKLMKLPVKTVKSILGESDAYDNERYEIKGGIAYKDIGNTPDKKNHVYAPDKKTAEKIFKQGKKVFREAGEISEENLAEFTSDMIKRLKKSYSTMPQKLSTDQANALSRHLDRLDLTSLKQLSKEKIPFITTLARNKIYKKTGKFEEVEEPKKDNEKKETENKDNTISSLKDQISMLKQKLENEKNKAIKPEPNPETGEVPLTIGLANKLLKDKEKKEKEDVQEADLSKPQIKKVHKMADELPKKDFKDRYGKEKGDAVRYATATNIVKKKLGVESTSAFNLKEIYYNLDRGIYIMGKDFRKFDREKEKRQGFPNATKLLSTTKAAADYVAKMNLTKKAKEKFNEGDMKNENMRLRIESIAGIKKKAEKSGMPYSILKKVFDRGMAAWKGGHRPGASQHQWAFARVNSFVTKSSGTWGGADKDLAKQVRGSK